MGRTRVILEEQYDATFQRDYMGQMRRKLGLTTIDDAGDEQLVQSLLDTMQRCGADFTASFRALSLVPPPPPPLATTQQQQQPGER